MLRKEDFEAMETKVAAAMAELRATAIVGDLVARGCAFQLRSVFWAARSRGCAP